MDEAYFTAISKELMHYKQHLKGKTVFCGAGDSAQSHFWKFFHLNFEELKLRRLIYLQYSEGWGMYHMVYEGGYDSEPSVANGISYVIPKDWNIGLVKNEYFRLIKEADIVVTNSQRYLLEFGFTEYIMQLLKLNKKFIIWGFRGVLDTPYMDCQSFFPLLRAEKVWVGYLFSDSHGVVFTNLDIERRHKELTLTKKYTPKEYPKYDNYDAIEVGKVSEIPIDYDGNMGVPITFLSKHNPEQFEILGLLQNGNEELTGLPMLRCYNNFKEMNSYGEETGLDGTRITGSPVLWGRPTGRKEKFFYNPTTGECVYAVYARVLIRRKNA